MRSLFVIIIFICLFFSPILADTSTINQKVYTDAEGIEHTHPVIDSSNKQSEAATEIEKTQKDTEKTEAPDIFDFLLSGKYIAFMILMIVALTLLLGRKVYFGIRIGLLAVAFILFGLDYFYPLHPSPMCAVTKLFMFRFTFGKGIQIG